MREKKIEREKGKEDMILRICFLLSVSVSVISRVDLCFSRVSKHPKGVPDSNQNINVIFKGSLGPGGPA